MNDDSGAPKREWKAPPERRIGQSYLDWLRGHLDGAKVRYEELSRLDDADQASGAEGEYYEQAHQMFGYIAALEKCLREAQSPGAAPSEPTGTDPAADSRH